MDIFGLHLNPSQKLLTTLSTGATGYDLPTVIACGARPGKTLLLTAQIHAMEYNGTPALLDIGLKIDPRKLCGNVIILPCVNLRGAQAHHPRTLPEDGFNLNGDFPGRADCPVGTALAGWFIREVFPKIDFICDLHGGSVEEELSPCLFYPRTCEAARDAARALDVPALIASDAQYGLYSYAWHTFSIPGLLLERGWGCTCRSEWIEGHRRNVCLLMEHLGMYDWSETPVTTSGQCFDRSVYMDADATGLWFPEVMPGEHFVPGQRLGQIRDYSGEVLREYIADCSGFVYYESRGLSIDCGSFLIAYGIEEPT